MGTLHHQPDYSYTRRVVKTTLPGSPSLNPVSAWRKDVRLGTGNWVYSMFFEDSTGGSELIT